MLTLYDEKGRTCTIGKLLHRVNIRDTDESHTAIVEEFGDGLICSGELQQLFCITSTHTRSKHGPIQSGQLSRVAPLLSCALFTCRIYAKIFLL